jgi:Holliday junction resolvase RusA-like endonuclease
MAGVGVTLPLDIQTPGTVLVPGNETGRVHQDGEALGTRPALAFVVTGTPAPQGSKRAFVNQHTGRVAMVESSAKVKPWREAVKHAAVEAFLRATSDGGPLEHHPLAGPLMLTVVYTLARPKGHYRTGRNAHLLRDSAPKWPATKPDVGKLTRATEDAIGDAGVWRDDAQVVVSLSIKTYPGVHPKAMTTPGAYVRISQLPESA